MPNATIQAEDLSTHLILQTTSTHTGDFTIPSAPPGDYQLTLTASGFSSLTLPQINVEAGNVTEIHARLRVAWTNSIPTIDNPNKTIDLSESPTSSRIEGADDDQSFTAVPRGTATEPNGQPEELADQTPGTNSRHRASETLTFSQEAVREAHITTQNYSALYSHSLGGIVTTVSKNGTNTLHATAFYQARTSAWNATNPFSIATNYINGIVTSAMVKPHDLRQQFGGSIGGALIQDKLFYVYANDQLHRDFPAISAPNNPNFYSLTATQTALLANRGITPTKINVALTYLNSLTGDVPRRTDQDISFAKLYWKTTEKNQFALQYNRARITAPAALRLSPALDRGPASLGISFVRVDAVMGRWTWRAKHHLRPAEPPVWPKPPV